MTLNHKQFCEILRHISFGMDQLQFREVFGESMGDHFWRKFEGYDRNAAKLIAYMDYDYLDKLFAHGKAYLKRNGLLNRKTA